jgi:hypothetical protein|tara:strand:- start:68 stop:238 length:171 start_codon:yes stop_codon:yes gene_type:complete
MNYTVLRSTVIINRAIHAVWDAVKFPRDIKRYHPLIKEPYMTSDKQSGRGQKDTAN